MDEQEMDRIEQEQYMEDLRGYIAEQVSGQQEYVLKPSKMSSTIKVQKF